MSRIGLLLLFAGLLSPLEAKKPNILILMADDLGFGDVGAFGNTTIRTPNIDRLAAEGMKLTQHLTPSPLCTPSRAAFLTGRYPTRLGMAAHHRVRVIPFIASTAGLPPNETTFAEVAKRNGYNTGYIGKWHLGAHCTNAGDFCHHPMKKGFDYFYGCLLTLLKDFSDHGQSVVISNNPRYRMTANISALVALVATALLWKIGLIGRRLIALLVGLTLLGLLIAHIVPHTGVKYANSILHRKFDVVEQPIRFENLTQRLVWESVEYLEKQSKQASPFLLQVSWFHVHTPLYNSVPEFRGRSRHGAYGDNIEEMDWSVGEILNALDRLGLANDTLVLFTSDNGGHVEELDHLGQRAGGYNGPWRGGKAHGGWDGGYRVPTVVRWPQEVSAGSASDEMTSNMDVFPTVAAAMGADASASALVDGVSLLPLLRGGGGVDGGATPLGERFLFQYCGHVVFAVRWRRADGVWKLRLASPGWLPGSEQCSYVCSCFTNSGVVFHEDPPLYNLDEDPEERRPLDTSVGAHAEVVRRMLEAVREHQRSIGDVPSQFSLAKTIWRPWLQSCCNFPRCNCRDTKWSGK